MEAIIALVAVAAGAMLGFGLRVLTERLAEPILEIEDVVGPFLITAPVPDIMTTAYQGPVHYNAYRVRVRNRQRRFFSTSARNVIAWLALDERSERYQVSWVPEAAAIEINVGDYREVDVLALDGERHGRNCPHRTGLLQARPQKAKGGELAPNGKFRGVLRKRTQDDPQVLS